MSALVPRTHLCGQLRDAHAGQQVVLQGWAHLVRDNGGVLFVVLRDRTGTVQVTVDERAAASVWDEGRRVRLEYVVHVEGLGLSLLHNFTRCRSYACSHH